MITFYVLICELVFKIFISKGHLGLQPTAAAAVVCA
jgi:hypothetical protein